MEAPIKDVEIFETKVLLLLLTLMLLAVFAPPVSDPPWPIFLTLVSVCDSLAQDFVETGGISQVFTSQQAPPDSSNSDSALDHSTTSTRDAFLKFQRDALAEDGENSRFFHRNHTLAANDANAVEDPVSKYNRLQAELGDLRSELEGLAKKETESKDLFTTIKAQEATELAVGAHALQTQLEQLGKTEAFQPFLAPTFDGHSTVASQQLLNKINELQGNSSDSASDATSSGGAEGAGGLTYELFYNKELQKEHAHSSLNGLENRLHKLEEMVGLKSLDVNTAGKPLPLSEVVTRLEERVQILDEDTLEKLTEKMQKLNTVFETFTAKRKKSKQSNITLEKDVEAQRVDKLFQTVQQWAPIADTIPTLINRMQTLKKLHEESCLFSQRLFGLENMQDGLKKMLAADEKALDSVQKSIAENMETIKANVTAVDQRIEEISKKVT